MKISSHPTVLQKLSSIKYLPLDYLDDITLWMICSWKLILMRPNCCTIGGWITYCGFSYSSSQLCRVDGYKDIKTDVMILQLDFLSLSSVNKCLLTFIKKMENKRSTSLVTSKCLYPLPQILDSDWPLFIVSCRCRCGKDEEWMKKWLKELFQGMVKQKGWGG